MPHTNSYMTWSLSRWFKEVLSAEKRLSGQANVTPVLTSRMLDRTIGASVYLKCENFQRAGAFKFRGAFNAMSRLTAPQRKKGVITYSSGNHAQAVALTGALLGIKTTVVMPYDAPKIKREATAGYGASVVEYNPRKADRGALAASLQEKHGYILIPPYDHPDVICGQGTSAMEIFTALEHLDWLLVPCGGGGLLSGSAIAAKKMDPSCRIIGVEPELADDATRSFHTGKLQTVKNPPTIADGTRTPSLGRITFPLVCRYVDDMVTVSEAAIVEAVRFLFFRMKLVVEPSGALGVAALLSTKILPQGRVGVILSGGNMDASTLLAILDDAFPKAETES